jgi:hypothetical protein
LIIVGSSDYCSQLYGATRGRSKRRNNTNFALLRVYADGHPAEGRPLQQIMATLTVHVPTAVHGSSASPVRMDATVVGRDSSGKVLDGLTFVIWVDD